MTDPRNFTSRGFSQGNQQLRPFPVSIPPPPLPPRFPPSNIPPAPIPHPAVPIPPPPLPPRFPPSNIPPPPPITSPAVPPNFLPPQFPRTPTFPTQTFQGGIPMPPWSTHQQLVSQSAPENIMLSQPNVQETSRPEEESCRKLDSQDVINNWLRRKRISRVVAKEPVKKDIQIHIVKEKFNCAFTLIKELENGARTLTVMVKSVTPQEWSRKCDEIEGKKKELTKVLKELKLSKEEVNALKEKCSKQSKKRARLRRQTERRKKQKEEEKVKEQNINFQIDNWQREMQEEVERVQRQEDMQRQADAVLWGVTQEKTEARRQVALLSGLLELRQVRVKRLTAAGTPVSQLQIQTFNTVIERLKSMWTKHLDRCQLEEQALRGMLMEADIKADPVKTHKKLVLQEWETALFGAVGILDTTPRGDHLVNIRRSWDQFAAQDHSVLSTTVPPGWVLPVPPSSEEWRKLLKY